MYLFLDFDGVLRRLPAAPGCFEPELLENFESSVRQLQEASIVVTSTWRLEMSLSELRELFSGDIAERILGSTPETLSLTPHSRYNEVRTYLKTVQDSDALWLAIDDDPAHFPHDAPVLLTDPYRGFDRDRAKQLVDFFTKEKIVGGAIASAPPNLRKL
jgi:hypothetical protein